MKDPTREEIEEFIVTHPYYNEMSQFDIEEAIYWFANDYHSGQSSNLYEVLSMSEFSPGPIAKAENMSDMAKIIYSDLKWIFE